MPRRRNSVNRRASISNFQKIGTFRAVGDSPMKNQVQHKESEIKLVNMKNQHLMHENSMQVKDFGNG